MELSLLLALIVAAIVAVLLLDLLGALWLVRRMWKSGRIRRYADSLWHGITAPFHRRFSKHPPRGVPPS